MYEVSVWPWFSNKIYTFFKKSVDMICNGCTRNEGERVNIVQVLVLTMYCTWSWPLNHHEDTTHKTPLTLLD